MMKFSESFNSCWRFALLVGSFAQTCFSYIEDSPLELTDIFPEGVKKYNKLVPPFVNKNTSDPRGYDPVVVQFYIYIYGLGSIDEASMTYSADIYLAQTWIDHRLSFPNSTNDYRVLDNKWLKHIWRPDAYFRNAKSIQFHDISVPNHYLRRYSNNTLLYGIKLRLRLACTMNFAFYPHDTQKCKIRIQSLSHRTYNVIYKWSNRNGGLLIDVHSEYFDLPQLALTEAHLVDCTYTYVDGIWPCLEVVFILKRIMGYYVINSYIPTCLIVIISWISFWMRPEVLTARVPLCVTSLLTLLYQHGKSQESLPHVAYFKLVDAFMLMCTIFVFLGLMELCLIIVTLSGCGIKRSSKVGSAVTPKKSKQHRHRPSIFSIKTVLYDSAWSSSDNSDSFTADEQLQRALLIDRISQVLFPTSFVFLNCLYWFIALFHEQLFG